MDKIRLNFFHLTNQKFEFLVWRKEYQQREKREGSLADFHRNTLPEDNQNLEKRKDYWISFEPNDDFEEFICNHNSNHKLTQHYLYYLLQSKTENILSQTAYILPARKFRKYINYVLKKHKEGKEIVWLEPYYLESKKKFGYLIDFKFRKNDNVPFDREIQRLSLSLDKSYRSNRNFYVDKFQKIRLFLEMYKSKLFPLTIDVNNTKIDISNSLEDIPISTLGIKKYIFGNGVNESSQFKGLDNYGPFKGMSQKVILAFIYQKREKFLRDDLYDALTGNAPGILFKGLESKIFGIKIDQVRNVEINDFSDSSFDIIIEEIRELKQASDNKVVMPVMIGDKTDESTYYTMKYRLLKEELPLQVVTRQLLIRRDSLKWSASSIALQLFSKLGGKPWKVVPSHEKSIIFGIGQA